MFPLILIGAAVGAYFLFFSDSAPDVGDTATVNSVPLVFRQIGAGMGFAPVDAGDASHFVEGMIVQIRGKSWKWFTGLGGFVQV